VYPDGSYLQFSTNYHRVVIQLFTWAFRLAAANGDRFGEPLYDRLRRSLDLLYQMQDLPTGHLPNYGANDGALFFRLNGCAYRDFRPQLEPCTPCCTAARCTGRGLGGKTGSGWAYP
jgi:hypothetical protein